MAKIINLRTARKNKQRAEKERLADSNRAKFGQSQSSRRKSKADQKNLEDLLDSAKITDSVFQSDAEKD